MRGQDWRKPPDWALIPRNRRLTASGRPQPDENPRVSLLSDPWFLAAAVLSVTFLGISKGGFLGLGIIAVPLLSLIIPPQKATAILLPIILAQDAVSIWVYHRDFSVWNLKVLLPGVAVGAVLAWLFAASWSVAMLRVAVGSLAMLFIISRIAGPWLDRHIPKPNAKSGLVLGVIAGFASTLANAGGPAYQIHMLPQKLPPLTFVGTTTMFFAFSNVVKIPAYAALGTLTLENLSIGVALVPLAVATNFLGVWLLKRVPMEMFYRIAYVLIFLVSVELIRGGVIGLLWH